MYLLLIKDTGMTRVDITGKTFGYLTVIGRGATVSGRTKWVCRCKCTKTVEVVKSSLVSKATKSCGCWRTEKNRETALTRTMKRKGSASLVRTPTYNSWAGMVQRVNYSTTGLKLDPRWYRFNNFYEDMGPRPDGYRLLLIDRSRPYCKDNCKWIAQ